MKIIVMLLLLSVEVFPVWANETAGEIQRYQGTVKVLKNGGPRGEKVTENGHKLFVRDKIKTFKQSMAVIHLTDNSDVVLKEKTIMEITGIQAINIDSGKVLFHIKKQKGIKGILITSKTVVIGVKGTKFLVDSNSEDLRVYVQEGVLSIKSLTGEFEKYSKKEGDEFTESMKEFKEYKTRMEEEFREFVKEFDLYAGKAVVISGNEVRDIEALEDIEKEFELLME